jgi:hypothetical protein
VASDNKARFAGSCCAKNNFWSSIGSPSQRGTAAAVEGDDEKTEVEDDDEKAGASVGLKGQRLLRCTRIAIVAKLMQTIKPDSSELVYDEVLPLLPLLLLLLTSADSASSESTAYAQGRSLLEATETTEKHT